MPDTKRSFLTKAGRASGCGAAFALMQTLDLLPAATRKTIPGWTGDTGKGVRVAILGGGIARKARRAQLDHSPRRHRQTQ
jgi:monoamine oxidase